MAQKHNSYEEQPMTRYGTIQGPSRRYRRLRHPSFPAAVWAAKNPLLQRGELGVEIDTHQAKIGDGTTYWNDLPYALYPEYHWGDIVGDIDDQTDLKDALDGLQGQITDNKDTMDGHIADKNNPHEVTKAQVGLGNCDNTSDLDKPISTATQTALNGKQDVISDLDQIRSNATAGKSASDTIATYGDIVTHNVSEFATSAQGALADTALQPGDNVSELVNDAGYLTQHQTLADLGITATAAEINVLDGITATTTELNYVDGVTSSIQTQITTNKNTMDGHIANTSNPHSVTKSQVGLGNCDNTSDLNKPISTATQTALDGKQAKSASDYNMGNSTGGWTAMTTAQQNALNSGATTTNIGQIATNTSNIANEIIDRQNADNGLQGQIDAIVSKSDVVDIVGTYAELQAYDTTGLGNNDVVKVISDSTHNDAPSYYRWVITGGVGAWVYIGSESETYTKAETDALLNAKQDVLTAGSNITISGNTISATDTTYTGSDGITLTGTNFTNSGVRSVASGSTNGTISVNTNGTSVDVAVYGLGSAAYTASTAYATSAQGSKADTAVQPGDLATVATTGDYGDLLNKPTIPTVDQTYDATSANAQSGVAINGANFLVNNAAGSTNGVAIKGSGGVQSTQIGVLGSAVSMSTSVGFSCFASGTQSIAVGHGSQATASKSYAFGEQAKSTAIGAFQFGQATNNEAGSVYFGLTLDGNTTNNYKLLGSDGLIPDARISSNIARTSDIPTVNNPTITITQGGVTKGSFTLNQASGDTIALDAGGGGSSLPSQTGHAGEFLTTDGTDASWSDKPLVNKATGTDSLTILGTGATNSHSINIGSGSSLSSATNQTVVGDSAKTVGSSSNNATVLGAGAKARNAARGIAIGAMSDVNAAGAIQIGTVSTGGSTTNSDANTFKVANANGNFEIMSADGTIPTDRYTTTPSADGTYVPKLTISSGVVTRSWGADGIDYIVEKQDPSAGNNYTWYRKYKSGWVEQGQSRIAAADQVVQITFPVEMADTYYVWSIGRHIYDVTAQNTNERYMGVINRTTTGFNVADRWGHTYAWSWQVSGMAA